VSNAQRRQREEVRLGVSSQIRVEMTKVGSSLGSFSAAGPSFSGRAWSGSLASSSESDSASAHPVSASGPGRTRQAAAARRDANQSDQFRSIVIRPEVFVPGRASVVANDNQYHLLAMQIFELKLEPLATCPRKEAPNANPAPS
jgi:hypothetical protein